MSILSLVLLFLCLCPLPSLAVEYSPLIQSEDFSGIKGDVMTAAQGILSILLIVLAVGIIYRILTR